MGWENYHLYDFKTADYLISSEEFELTLISKTKRLSSTKIPIARFINETKDEIEYTYDFGDDWEHIISVSQYIFLKYQKR